jgi:predicted nucleic acid-binding protein
MTLDDIPDGTAIFLDANTLLYHFTGHARYGAACTRLLERIERKQVEAFTSAHVLGDVVHRVMTIEAMTRLGWPQTGLAARLRKHHSEIPKLSQYQQALVKIGQIGIRVLSVSEQLVVTAATHCQQFELLVGDALIVAVMRQQGLSHLASKDSDFGRVPGITRYAPA